MSKSDVSFTAWVVIACHLALARHPKWRSLIGESDLSFYKRSDSYCQDNIPICRILGALPAAWKLAIVEKIVAKGAPQHFVFRKKAIAQQVEQSIAGGIKQLVILGAGFDTLAVTIAHRHPEIRCFEIDVPGMHEVKRLLIEESGGKPANFFPVAADLSQVSLKEVLDENPAYDSLKNVLFIVEGVTMYLKEADVRSLFDDIRKSNNAPSVIFTAIERVKKPSHGLGGIIRDLVLSKRGEEFNWSKPMDEISGFLSEHGFVQQRLIPYADLQKGWRDDHEMDILRQQPGEYLVYATHQ